MTARIVRPGADQPARLLSVFTSGSITREAEARHSTARTRRMSASDARREFMGTVADSRFNSPLGVVVDSKPLAISGLKTITLRHADIYLGIRTVGDAANFAASRRDTLGDKIRTAGFSPLWLVGNNQWRLRVGSNLIEVGDLNAETLKDRNIFSHAGLNFSTNPNSGSMLVTADDFNYRQVTTAPSFVAQEIRKAGIDVQMLSNAEAKALIAKWQWHYDRGEDFEVPNSFFSYTFGESDEDGDYIHTRTENRWTSEQLMQEKEYPPAALLVARAI